MAIAPTMMWSRAITANPERATTSSALVSDASSTASAASLMLDSPSAMA
ncbi:hypothetical protein [Pseudarthrobacter sp. Y6]